MKLFLPLSIFILSSISLFSQSERVVFVEEFTQASCPPCETTTPALNAILEAQGDRVVQLRYQTSQPGVDPMNADNPEDVLDRALYYEIIAVPTAFIDGVQTQTFGTVKQPELDAAYAVAAPLALTVSHTLSDNLSTVDVNVTITNEGTAPYSVSTNKLRVALMEEKISWAEPPGSTSLVDFEAVMKSFISGTDGIDIPMIEPGQSWEMTWTDVETPALVYNYNTLGVVAFIQDDADKSIVNGALSHPQILEKPDLTVTTQIETNGGSPCEYEFTGRVNVENVGDFDANGCDVIIIINDTETQTITYEDVIEAGTSVDITFDQTVLDEGSSSIAYKVVALEGDLKELNDNTDILIGKAGEPVTDIYRGFDDYTAGEFPFRDIIDRPFDFLNFMVSGIDGIDGSMNTLVINFFLWELDEFDVHGSYTIADKFLVPEDGAVLEFDRAMTTYQGSQDRLQIQISTDCAESYTTVWDAIGSGLATAPEKNGASWWVPTSASDWQTTQIDLSDFADQEIIIRFDVTSDNGDLLFLDNIKVTPNTIINTDDVLAETISFSLSPNPANDKVNIEITGLEQSSAPVELQIHNMLGKLVSQETLPMPNSQNQITYDVSTLSKGVYSFSLNVGNKIISKKLIISE